MRKFTDGLAQLAVTAWVGGLWGIGYLSVPVLFQSLPDRMLAGALAGKMFALIAYVGLASACYLLIYHLSTSGRAALRLPQFRIVAAMLLLTLIGQFVLQPIMADLKAQVFPGDVMHSALADRFKALHGIASISYLAQSLLGLALVLKAKHC
ncbi:MAG: DUF4149 domain-containing protein [Nitrosomonadales bacterium]|nr:DUF4149 domain-containing protein [Nitrosomonadales bacterium]